MEAMGRYVLTICRKLTGEHPCQSAISIKLLCKIVENILVMGALL